MFDRWVGKIAPGERNGCPLQYSCLESSTDRGAWQAPVLGLAEELDTTQQLTLYLLFLLGYNCFAVLCLFSAEQRSESAICWTLDFFKCKSDTVTFLHSAYQWPPVTLVIIFEVLSYHVWPLWSALARSSPPPSVFSHFCRYMYFIHSLCSSHSSLFVLSHR